MTPTPERALKLAELCENEAESGFDAAERAAGTPELADAYMHGVRISREKAAILRRYAEILPKWQAVLDAKPVAEVRPDVNFDDWNMLNYQFSVVNDLAVGTQLIIKPAP